MIPKIIHYVWVGNNPKPDLILKCIKSWKNYCPDYKIKEWGNADLAKINNVYVKEAFECKKWAFVSDYLRLYALFNEGGFYCDSDLEIRSPIDKFCKHSFVTGYESWNNILSPITAFMGAEKHNEIIKDLLVEYDNIHFIENGKMNQITNTKRISKYFKDHFNVTYPYRDITTNLGNNSIIYPSYFFCKPIGGKENYSIHHFNASWVDSFSRKIIFQIGRYRFVRFKKNRLGKNTFPLLENETIIFALKIFRKNFCILKEDKI